MRPISPTYEHPDADAYLAPGGAWDQPTLSRLLTDGRPTLVEGGRTLGPDEADHRTRCLAGGLRRAGVGRGATVLWQTPNWWESVILLRAVWHLGAVAVPLLPRLGPAEVAAAADLVDPALVLAGPGLPAADLDGAVGIRADDPRWDHLGDGPPLGIDDADPADIALVLFTAGSTGRPKAVLHTHRGLACKARAQLEPHGLGGDDVFLVPGPLGHIAGILNGVTLPGAAGMTTVLVERWAPELGVELIETHGVTFLGCPVVFLTQMAALGPDVGRRVASLRTVSIGGSSMTADQLAALSEALGCRVKRSYGSTEAPTVTTTHDTDPVEAGWTTDGRAIGQAQVRVVDPDTGREVPAGELGEVRVRGPELFAGYLDPADTRAAIADGWYRSGDLARMDAGFLTIEGRLAELVIRGGENIAPAEVEAVLVAHPAVTEAVVVGVPDPVLGERVGAVVVADADFDREACAAWFAEQGVARFKTPEVLAALASIPLLGAGKPDRRAIVELLEEADRGSASD